MAKMTPMMRQYMEIKKQHTDAVLMFRLGDFYEMFFEDAILASKILQITLTARNKKGEGESVPMCGVPYHALSGYLSKLTKAGKKVALCDQITEPDGKGIVEREVIRVITPGTTFDENVIEDKANNFVAAVVRVDSGFGFAYADVTTGDFKVTNLNDLEELRAEFTRISPSECIARQDDLGFLKAEFKRTYFFEYETYAETAEKMLFQYLKETQKSDLGHINKVENYQRREFMPLSEACIRNLELFYNNQDGKKEGSLISVMDETVTAMGGRMIRKWLMHPLVDREKISARLMNVQRFYEDSSLLRRLREALNGVYDIERLLSKLSLGTGNARDLVAMRESLKVIPLINQILGSDLYEHSKLCDLLDRAINDEPPAVTNSGGMIKKGFDAELDELLRLGGEGKSFIADLQRKEIERTGISSLKVKFNKVFGYYIEISKANLASVPEDYIRKQTLVNAERFITPELKEYEEKVLTAEERSKQLEYEIFYKVRMEVVKEMVQIQENARRIAELDVFLGLAFLAVNNNYCKPEIVDQGELMIENGRHPVVEKMVKDFVPNDCKLSEDRRFMLITGPNMGGKSTYLRQTALIVLLAQIGSFVPADKAQIPIVDQIFTRVGASDNLAQGQSTFMVEMSETANILKNATEKSLIILDELGRGTSTYDGVSIAWAISEFLHNEIKAKTIFATHYHELTELLEGFMNGFNMSVAVKENELEGVVFLYKIVEGGVDKSYGIEVAKLAGLPVEVVSRARGVLQKLEKKEFKVDAPAQMEIFERKQSNILERIKEIDINNLTSLQAMEKLNEIKTWE